MFRRKSKEDDKSLPADILEMLNSQVTLIEGLKELVENQNQRLIMLTDICEKMGEDVTSHEREISELRLGILSKN